MKLPAFERLEEPFKRHMTFLGRMIPSTWFVAESGGEAVGLIGGHKLVLSLPDQPRGVTPNTRALWL